MVPMAMQAPVICEKKFSCFLAKYVCREGEYVNTGSGNFNCAENANVADIFRGTNDTIHIKI
jgi:hypothetical protein